MRMHVIETETDAATVVTTDAGTPPGTMVLRVKDSLQGMEVAALLTDAERVRLIGQLAAFAPPLQYVDSAPSLQGKRLPGSGLRVDDLQPGDELRDTDRLVIYRTVKRLADSEHGDIVWQVAWDPREGGGLDTRVWTPGVVTPLVRP